jgi:hypothetical protein
MPRAQHNFPAAVHHTTRVKEQKRHIQYKAEHDFGLNISVFLWIVDPLNLPSESKTSSVQNWYETHQNLTTTYPLFDSLFDQAPFNGRMHHLQELEPHFRTTAPPEDFYTPLDEENYEL